MLQHIMYKCRFFFLNFALASTQTEACFSTFYVDIFSMDTKCKNVEHFYHQCIFIKSPHLGEFNILFDTKKMLYRRLMSYPTARKQLA